MTDTVLVWVLVAVVLVAALAVAGILRLRNRGELPALAGPAPVVEAALPTIPVQRSAGIEVPAPPAVAVETAPAEAPADPALAALDTRTPIRGMAALAADVLMDALRREGPFAGSVLPGGDGSTASDPAYRIKASTATRRFYRPESPHYQRTRAELWFRTVADAERAGFSGA
jgi:hypothetical protein